MNFEEEVVSELILFIYVLALFWFITYINTNIGASLNELGARTYMYF